MRVPKRKRPARVPVTNLGNRSNLVFLTVCTAGRRRILANAEVHRCLLSAWSEAEHWMVGRYVIMPDHLHLFCAPARLEAESVLRWVAFWKSLATRAWPHPVAQPIWQMHAWDRQLRGGESYAAKWAYLRENPVRHGLVKTADDWPYQGELNPLFWHDA